MSGYKGRPAFHTSSVAKLATLSTSTEIVSPPESNDITTYANRGSNAGSLMKPHNKTGYADESFLEYVLATLDKIVNWAHQASTSTYFSD
ncbi:6863_t:CDS:2 [Acaulospora colombiana]|uniref:6863_t:CDS:1 n=1 Tax=Acaulospora colombiana TaxID=27376 RepID=A0ACA9M5N7_9GLOM|nr:6863_t:CDS:2 [Acaulospora colombiana]